MTGDNKAAAIEQPPKAGIARRATAALGVVVLSGLSLYSTVGLAVSAVAPPVAAAITPGHSQAAARMLDLTVATTRTRASFPGIQQSAVRILSRAPLDHRTARSFATVDLVSNRTARGNAVMRLVGGATMRDSVAHAWLLNKDFERGDYVSVVREADIMLRNDVSIQPAAFAMLRTLVADGRAVPQLAQSLITNPPWRGGFLSDLGTSGSGSENELRLLRMLRASASPPQAEELRTWMLRMTQTMDAQQLLATYHELRPSPFSAAESLIRNGTFEGTSAVPPFDWSFFNVEQGFAEVSASPEGPGQALYSESNGSADIATAMQLIPMPAGDYVLRLRSYPLTTITPGSAALRLSCRSGNAHPMFATMPINGNASVWTNQSWRFSVPANCNGPYIWLQWQRQTVRAASQLYIDDMVISRAAARQP